MSDRIIVVSAAIVNVAAKRLFVQRRSGDTTYPWHWCTPGGKANENEPPFLALGRELREEHGVRLDEDALAVGHIVYQQEIASSRSGQMTLVTCYRIPHEFVDGVYNAGPKVAGFDWVSANEFEHLMLTPADHANRDKLLALIR